MVLIYRSQISNLATVRRMNNKPFCTTTVMCDRTATMITRLPSKYPYFYSSVTFGYNLGYVIMSDEGLLSALFDRWTLGDQYQ